MQSLKGDAGEGRGWRGRAQGRGREVLKLERGDFMVPVPVREK